MHHPWRAFRNLVDWTLEWSDLPEGLLGYTNFDTKTVTLTNGMTQAERRCTIAHETQHIHRGGGVCDVREEVRVDLGAARLLLPDIRAIGEALAWSHTMEEAAAELWVDEVILRSRLEHLHPAERGYLKARLAEVE